MPETWCILHSMLAAGEWDVERILFATALQVWPVTKNSRAFAYESICVLECAISGSAAEILQQHCSHVTPDPTTNYRA
ncbi:hypothetical protein ACLOJK_016714 [Asimina triloba]